MTTFIWLRCVGYTSNAVRWISDVELITAINPLFALVEAPVTTKTRGNKPEIPAGLRISGSPKGSDDHLIGDIGQWFWPLPVPYECMTGCWSFDSI